MSEIASGIESLIESDIASVAHRLPLQPARAAHGAVVESIRLPIRYIEGVTTPRPP
jgi:hypothetical protein